MTIEKISFKEFRQKYSQSYFESFDSNDPDSNLPSLRPASSAENVREIHEEANKILTKRNCNNITKIKSNTLESTALPQAKQFANTPHYRNIF